MFALNSHTYSPLFEKILDPPLKVIGGLCNINLQKTRSCTAIKLEIKLTLSNFYFATYKNTQELIGNTYRQRNVNKSDYHIVSTEASN